MNRHVTLLALCFVSASCGGEVEFRAIGMEAFMAGAMVNGRLDEGATVFRTSEELGETITFDEGRWGPIPPIHWGMEIVVGVRFKQVNATCRYFSPGRVRAIGDNGFGVLRIVETCFGRTLFTDGGSCAFPGPLFDVITLPPRYANHRILVDEDVCDSVHPSDW